MEGADGATGGGYCNQCDDTVEVHLTVPWQEDVCTRCGSTDVEVEG